ncbi:MAG TPA: signal peptidase II [Gammaproteobacteria bacterium]|nr:signal peptidase II [Gammaproteobacteria bacterium]
MNETTSEMGMTEPVETGRQTGRHGALGQVRWLWISAAVIVFDQITKLLISHHMGLFDSIGLTPFLRLTLLHNSGAAFSFLSQASGWQRWFFIGLGLVVSIVILLWLRKLPRKRRRLLGIGLALVLGGALGNVIDRVAYGYVIDFIDFFYHGWNFPPFNVADSSITVGAILVIIDTLLASRQQSGSIPQG